MNGGIDNTFTRPPCESYRREMIDKTIPKVTFTRKAFLKMKALIQQCDIEISWMVSCVREAGSLNFRLLDVFVPMQTCSPTTTVMSADGVAAMDFEFLQSKSEGQLKCWGHSHVNMAVFASGTDESQTQDFLSYQSEFFIRIIGNKRGEMTCHVYVLNKQGEVHAILHHPDLVVEPEVKPVPKEVETLEAPDDFMQWAQDEIKAKVEQPASLWGRKQPREEPPKDEEGDALAHFFDDNLDASKGPLAVFLEKSLTRLEDIVTEEAGEAQQEPIRNKKGV